MIANYLNALDDAAARRELTNCCASVIWVDGMLVRRPFDTDEAVFAASRDAAMALTEVDWLEAFAAHPMIGDVETLRGKFAATKAIAADEQADAADASEAVLADLAAMNRLYFERHGFIFIVCATGKSAAEMLAMLRRRIDNTRQQELQTAAEEQLKITELRLRKAAK